MLNLHVLIGKSMSGKSTVLNHLRDTGIQRLITTTNRPKRTGEENHKEYHFVDQQQLQNDLKNDHAIAPRFYHVANGDTWCYYLSTNELQSAINQSQQNATLILDLKGFVDLTHYLNNHPQYDVKLHGWFLNTPLRTRLERYVNGPRHNEDPHEVIRRFYMDEFKDFNQINDPKFVKKYKLKLINDDHPADIILKSIKEGES